MNQCRVQDHDWHEVTAIGDTRRSFICGNCGATMSTQSNRYFTWQRKDITATPVSVELAPKIRAFLEGL